MEMWARKKEDVGRKAVVTNTAQPGGLRAFRFLRQRYPGQRECEEGNKQQVGQACLEGGLTGCERPCSTCSAVDVPHRRLGAGRLLRHTQAWE